MDVLSVSPNQTVSMQKMPLNRTSATIFAAQANHYGSMLNQQGLVRQEPVGLSGGDV